MGNPIKDYTVDTVVNVLDELIGTEYGTEKTKNYTIQSIVDLITASSSSIINTNIISVQETVAGNFLTVINTSVSGHVVNVGDMAWVLVADTSGDFKALYHLIKTAVTASITYGLGETQMVTGDLLLVRQVSDTGESNTMSSLGGTSLVGTKSGVVLPIKGISNGTNITVTDNGTDVEIAMNASLGETNTASNVGSGEGVWVSKTSSNLEFKSITATGASVSSSATEVDINIWSNEEVSGATKTLTDADKNKTFWLTNASATTITVPDGLATDFTCAFYGRGSGTYTFSFTGAGTPNPAGNTKISAQYGTAWIEMNPATANEWMFVGDVGV